MKLIRKMKDPGSAITHIIGLVLALIGSIPLLVKATFAPTITHFVVVNIYLLGLVLLYTASSLYHSFDICDKVNRRLKKFDHMMISLLIAVPCGNCRTEPMERNSPPSENTRTRSPRSNEVPIFF